MKKTILIIIILVVIIALVLWYRSAYNNDKSTTGMLTPQQEKQVLESLNAPATTTKGTPEQIKAINSLSAPSKQAPVNNQEEEILKSLQ